MNPSRTFAVTRMLGSQMAANLARYALTFILVLLNHPVFAADYVGAKACFTCHQTEAQLWQKSDHFHAMQEATAANVLGDFDNVRTRFHGVSTRFFKNENEFFVETLAIDGEVKSFKVLYTFGYRPLQQYLVDVGDGKLQAFNIAWDSRSEIQGGQRWFHLRPDENISPEHPFFWQGYFQNWNSGCAVCHTTNLEKNYNPQSRSYATSWSDINVACEACHGPGSAHLALVQSKELSGSNTGLLDTGKRTAWVFEEGDSIANPVSASDEKEIDICGGCHSRRALIADSMPGADYHDQYRLQTLSPGLYFADGQIQDEVFVLGSFLQSKMYQKGVRCTNCHEPHSGELRLQGNALCGQCHQSASYDSPTHHGHDTGSAGSFCVDCHMPERRYMSVDDRRDHSFVVPKQLRQQSTNPSACLGCHQDKDTDWHNRSVKTLFSKAPLKTQPDSDWSVVNERSRSFDFLSVRGLARSADNVELAPIIRATMLEQLANFPSRVTLAVATSALKSKEPMVRRAAVSSLGFLPAAERWSLLSALADDDRRSVRFEVAAIMADVIVQLPGAEQIELKKLISEYRDSLSLALDSPGAQLALADLDVWSGDLTGAEKHFQAALDLSPGFVPALLNYAEFQRRNGKEQETEKLLAKSLQIAPDSAGAQHAYGLYLIRQKQDDVAITHLQTAATIETALPRYAYVYAVALDNTGLTDKAMVVLKEADERWPNQMDILNLLLMYAEKLNQLESNLGYLSRLSAIAPASPLVRRLIQNYQTQ